MLRLVLMRHAKSDWSLQAPDHERPLNPRGIRAARALGVWLRSLALLPDVALVSTARRTRETWGLLGLDAPVRYDRGLYDAEADGMIDILRKASERTVLMLGHNPATCECAHRLLADPPTHHRFDDCPTGATLVAEFDVSTWSDITPGTGQAVAFVTPGELPGD